MNQKNRRSIAFNIIKAMDFLVELLVIGYNNTMVCGRSPFLSDRQDFNLGVDEEEM